MTGFSRMPPKYQCTECNRMFRRRKQQDDHILFNRCKGNNNRKRGTNKKQIVIQPQVELKTIQSQPYFGRPFNFNNIPTGNRHYRCGLPLPRFNIGMRTAI